MSNQKDILWRIYLTYFMVTIIAIVIIVKTLHIQIYEGQALKEKAQTLTMRYFNIEAIRGNIYDTNGNLLATSVPIYDVFMDVNADAITNHIFNTEIDSLALNLSRLFRDKSKADYKSLLVKARKKGDRYLLIQRNVKYQDVKVLKTFPIFRRGRYKGGLILEQKSQRIKPFKWLAARTIGRSDDLKGNIGIEGAYNDYLKGKEGLRLMQKLSGGLWKPINDDNEVEPQDGYDVYSTIDINLQDVAEYELKRQLEMHNADHGCVVLMEVETGDVKAIANLKKDDNGYYDESYNYAIGESTEPGSTFKLASLVAAMEDGLVDLNDMVDTEDGTHQFYNATMRDSKEGGYGQITVRQAFEVSSNVGISKIIFNRYAKHPQKFIDRLYKMHLNEVLGIDISGEGKPYIKSTKDKTWSGTSLPWMSIGYEVRQTPLQILAFYNAIANNGKLLAPRFVKQINFRGKLIKQIPIQVIDNAICSKTTAQKAQSLLEGVVERGTATNLQNPYFKIAGKTGTAQIANGVYGYKYDSQISHQASFVGYFPADKPKYSCIVVVNAPSNNVYYGNLVAGPIFKAVADKVYANSLDIHKPLPNPTNYMEIMPSTTAANTEDLRTVLNFLNISVSNPIIKADWVSSNIKGKQIQFTTKQISNALVPNVYGLGVKDAVYILENRGLKVKVLGKGIVREQSITAGSKIIRGQTITLHLS